MKYPHRKQHIRLPEPRRNLLRFFRKWCGHTQSHLAQMFRVSQPTVCRIVRGQ